jgi:kynurenine formamidase
MLFAKRACLAVTALAALWLPGCSSAPDPFSTMRVVDLSHAFDESTLYWPTDGGFQHERVAWGRTPAGFFYSSNRYAANEHGGTHLDAPIHFAEGRRGAAEIPVEQLRGPAAVIDIARQCQADRDYRLTVADLEENEQRHGSIAAGSVILVRTGWGRFWPDARQYLGDDTPGDASNLHFPGLSREAAEWLVARNVHLVGIDTASIDPGDSKDFPAHQVLAAAEIPGLENVASLDQLPARGAHVIAAPMKIAGGSGAPCRVLAFLPR